MADNLEHDDLTNSEHSYILYTVQNHRTEAAFNEVFFIPKVHVKYIYHVA